MTPRRARICCLDLDTFFVSVERLLDPGLEGKAVVVGGPKGGRGVVTSASYEARAFGVRSGMSIRDASALAPGAIFLPGHHEHYASYSGRARAIVERFSPVVVAASIDEQYVDFDGCESLYRKPEDADDDATILRVVRTMTKTIEDELGLPASAGIATSKSLAKVVCTLAKPRGVRLVLPGEEEAVLAPLSVRKLPGIARFARYRAPTTATAAPILLTGPTSLVTTQTVSPSTLVAAAGPTSLLASWADTRWGPNEIYVEPVDFLSCQ